MNILVTGGKGFIGSHLVGALLKERNTVEVFDFIDGEDIRNLDHVEEAIVGKDVVFHIAAVADLNWARENPMETMRTNVDGAANVAYVCSKNKIPLYFASTCCVYGNQEKHPENESFNPNPAEIYACTKVAGENIIRGFSLMYNFPINLMRLATIYGPGMRKELGVSIFFRQAIQNRPITIHGDGKQTRTLTYIDDLIEGIMMLFKSGKFLGAVNLSTTEEVSALSMAQKIKKLTNSKSDLVFVPQRPGQTFRESIDASKAKSEIGWVAKTSFDEGLKKTYKWFLENKKRYSA